MHSRSSNPTQLTAGNRLKISAFVAVGAVYIDTILNVPSYPQEDSKLRATSLTRRRGGNCPNLLEVLQQLVFYDSNARSSSSPSHAKTELQLGSLEPRQQHEEDRVRGRNESNSSILQSTSDLTPELHLISTLPARHSPQTQYTYDSFNHSDPFIQNAIHLEHCIHREDKTEAATSYVYSSGATGSRTIVNYNELDEMTVDEFEQAIGGIVSTVRHDQHAQDDAETSSNAPRAHRATTTWVHFEGRNPHVTQECIKFLRLKRDRDRVPHQSASNGESKDESVSGRKYNVVISVEVEKPGRDGLQDLARAADVVFYSRAWALHQGYADATTCLHAQAEEMGLTRTSNLNSNSNTSTRVNEGDEKNEDGQDGEQEWSPVLGGKWLFCTWGEEGSAGMFIAQNDLELGQGFPVSSAPGDTHSLLVSESAPVVVHRPAWKPISTSISSQPQSQSKSQTQPQPPVHEDGSLKVIDAVGAGDSWTAGMLYTLLVADRAGDSDRGRDGSRSNTNVEEQDIAWRLDFANELAGRKIGRDGFAGLGREMR